MDRRSFLLGLLGTAAAAALPAVLPKVVASPMVPVGRAFGIDPATYALWSSNAYCPCPSGPIDIAELQRACERLMERVEAEPVVLYLSPPDWARYQELTS